MGGASARSQLLSRVQDGRVETTAVLARLPAGAKLRCVLDKLIVEPLDVVHSQWLIIPAGGKPVRGIVRAVGPGHNPIIYFDSQGHRIPDGRRSHDRKRLEYSKRFRPTEVKVGDVIEVGGLKPDGAIRTDGYSFEQFWVGDVLHFSCHERDVCGIVTNEAA